MNRYNRKAELWGKTETENELGELDYIDGKIKDLFVRIVPQTGNMANAPADTVLAKVTTRFVCRYGSGKDIDETMWLIFNGRRHNIKWIVDPYAKQEEIELYCEEVV